MLSRELGGPCPWADHAILEQGRGRSSSTITHEPSCCKCLDSCDEGLVVVGREGTHGLVANLSQVSASTYYLVKSGWAHLLRFSLNPFLQPSVILHPHPFMPCLCGFTRSYNITKTCPLISDFGCELDDSHHIQMNISLSLTKRCTISPLFHLRFG